MTDKEKITQLLRSDCPLNRQLGCILGHNEGMSNVDMFDIVNRKDYTKCVQIGNYTINPVSGFRQSNNFININIMKVNSNEILNNFALDLTSLWSYIDSKHEAIEVFMNYVINK